MAARAASIIDSDDELYVTDGILGEAAYVLRSFYHVPRQEVIDLLIELIRKHSVQMFHLDKGTVIQALLYCRPSGRVSVADALLWAAARSSGIDAVYSFDERFPSDGVETLRHLR